MLRLILVAGTVVLFLILAIPVEWLLKREQKSDPAAAERKSLDIVRGVFRLVFRLGGITYEVQGLEHVPRDRAVLYVGNHRGYFDILIGYLTVPGVTGFVAKKEMIGIPLLRDWMQLLNCLFLDRDNIKEGLKTILEGIEKIRRGVSIWIFPEGTRSESADETEMLPFHGGSLKIAEKSGCPVIPVAIIGTSQILEDHMPWIRPGHIVIRYGEPIYLKELPPQQRKFAGAYVQGRVLEMLHEMKAGENGETKE